MVIFIFHTLEIIVNNNNVVCEYYLEGDAFYVF